MTLREREARADAMTARLSADGMAKARLEAAQARGYLAARKREAFSEAWLGGLIAACLAWPIFHNRKD